MRDTGTRCQTPASAKKRAEDGEIVDVRNDGGKAAAAATRAMGGEGSTTATESDRESGFEDNAATNALPTRPPPITSTSTEVRLGGDDDKSLPPNRNDGETCRKDLQGARRFIFPPRTTLPHWT